MFVCNRKMAINFLCFNIFAKFLHYPLELVGGIHFSKYERVKNFFRNSKSKKNMKKDEVLSGRLFLQNQNKRSDWLRKVVPRDVGILVQYNEVLIMKF